MRKFLPLFFIGLLLLCGCSEESYQYLYEDGYEEGYDKCYQEALSDFGMFPEDKLLEYVHEVYSIEDLYDKDYLKTYVEEVFSPEEIYSENELKDSLNEMGYETVIPDNTRAAPADMELEYVGNANTKKFHRLSCFAVQKMKQSNKRYGTRSELISKGYKPCSVCNP